MSMSGGGNNKSGPNPPSHFKMWRYTPQRRKQVRRGKEQFSPFSFFSEVPQSPDSLGLWTEWLPTPVYLDSSGLKIKGAYPDDIKSWLKQLNQFMKTYKSKTLVFRIQTPETGIWTENVDYTAWLKYWALDNNGLNILFSGVTTLKEIHFLPYINITDTTTKEEACTQASHAYDFIHGKILQGLPSHIKNSADIKNYMCIESENINSAKSPAPTTDYHNLLVTGANNSAKLTAMVVSKITKTSALLLSCVSAPTVGKSINLISGVDKYIGEWYSDKSIDELTPDFYNKSVSQITNSWLGSIKLGDTIMENYYAMLSIETNYQRHPNNDSGYGGYKSPKTNSEAARLGPQPQIKTIQLAQSITTAYHLKNEVLVYSGEYLEQWGKTNSDSISTITKKPADILSLKPL